MMNSNLLTNSLKRITKIIQFENFLQNSLYKIYFTKFTFQNSLFKITFQNSLIWNSFYEICLILKFTLQNSLSGSHFMILTFKNSLRFLGVTYFWILGVANWKNLLLCLSSYPTGYWCYIKGAEANLYTFRE